MSDLQNEAVATLIRMYQSSSSIEVKVGIAQGLGEAGGERALKALTSFYTSSTSKQVRAALAAAIGRAGAPRS